MFRHCILFGYRGHLAQTRIIPELQKHQISYTGISRKERVNLNHLRYRKEVFAFMSIPTASVLNNIEPYMDDFQVIKPLIVLEKPHGNSIYNFEKLCNTLDYYEFDYLFNDHYLFKEDIRNIEIDPRIKDVTSIQVTIHEDQCINDRIAYFDKVGILLDMYQSHVLMIVAKILSRHFDSSVSSILEDISRTEYHVRKVGKYASYKGKTITMCKLELNLYGINIHIDLEKNASMMKKEISIQTKQGNAILSLSKDNGYDNAIQQIVNAKNSQFMQKDDITKLWKHIEYNKYRSTHQKDFL